MISTKNKLKGFFTEHWKYMTVNTACRLNIFDFVEAGQNTLEQISEKINGDERFVILLLNALVQIDFLKVDKAKYKLTNESEYLTGSNPESLKNACILWGLEHLNAWQNLEYSVRTGMPSFEHLYGEAFFDYLKNKPDKLRNYHKAMFEYAKDDYKNICNVIDFSGYHGIMDVGGGLGALISEIKKLHLEKHCYLFEKPEVLKLSEIAEIDFIPGDFFAEIPITADCLILSRVLHDWDNEKAIKILQNVFSAIPTNGEVLIIENLTDKISNKASLLSLNMLAMCKSFERTADEYIQLLSASGLEYLETIKLNDLQYIIKAKKQ